MIGDQRLCHERIDVSARPNVANLARRLFDWLQSLEGPMFASALESRVKYICVGRPRGTLVDPRSQYADLGVTQSFLIVGRHHTIRVKPRDQMHEWTRVAAAADNYGTMFATLHDARFNCQIQAAFFISRRMALEAMRAKDRLHVAHKIDRSIGCGWQPRFERRLIIRANGQGRRRLLATRWR
jgi:hypothetical protein